MDRLCQFSTIVLAGNVSVLLIVAVSTDYWEYRGFLVDELKQKLKTTDSTVLESPPDTDSHFILRYYWNAANRKTLRTPDCCRLETVSQPPAVLRRYYYAENVTVNETHSVGARNLTLSKTSSVARMFESVVILFTQHSNLFRDCHTLEVEVRRRLKLTDILPRRCHNFLTRVRQDNYIARDMPAVIYIELVAFGCAVVSIASTIVSFIAGAYGSVLRDRKAIITASSSALLSGVSLTVAIALFHSKCEQLRRQTFMSGVDIGPYKREIEAARWRDYGWSFTLAWICVILSFIHCVAWLHNAQELEVPNREHRIVHRQIYHGLERANDDSLYSVV